MGGSLAGRYLFELPFAFTGILVSSEPRVPIASDAESGIRVELGGARIGSIVLTDSSCPPSAPIERLAVYGSGYSTEEDAEVAMDRVGQALEVAFLQVNRAVRLSRRDWNVYARGARLAPPASGADSVRSRMILDGARYLSAATVVPKIQGEMAGAYKWTERDRLAVQLANAAQFASGPEPRLVLLVSAIEALAEIPKREGGALEVARNLRTVVKNSGLSDDERDSLLASLNRIEHEPSGRWIRKMITDRLPDAQVRTRPPDQFYKDCYDVRSKLVHEGRCLVDTQVLQQMVGGLAVLATQLICYSHPSPPEPDTIYG